MVIAIVTSACVLLVLAKVRRRRCSVVPDVGLVRLCLEGVVQSVMVVIRNVGTWFYFVEVSPLMSLECVHGRFTCIPKDYDFYSEDSQRFVFPVATWPRCLLMSSAGFAIVPAAVLSAPPSKGPYRLLTLPTKLLCNLHLEV